MQSQNNDNQPGGGPWANQTNRMPDLEDLVRQLQSQLQQFLSGGGLREKIIIFCLILAGLVAWSSFYTVPSDSVAVLQRFGRYLKEVPPGLHFKLPLGVDAATIVPVKRQLKQEFGFTTPGATDPYQSPRDGEKENAGNTDGDRRPERRAGGVGGSIPHLGAYQVPFQGS